LRDCRLPAAVELTSIEARRIVNRKIAGILVGGATVIGSLAFAAPASASPSPPQGGSWDHVWTSTDSTHGATVYVEEHGDVIDVCDTASDGHLAEVRVAWDFDSFIIRASGYGVCTVSTNVNHDLPEAQMSNNITVSVYRNSTSSGPVNLYKTFFVNDH
jgi:hypothetical protein